MTHDFLRDKLKWTGKIRQANRIGRSMGMGKNRHVRVTFSNIEDKSAILKNRGLLKDTHIYIDEDLTINQQEERRKEWEKVKSARAAGKWAWMKNGKAQIADKSANQK